MMHNSRSSVRVWRCPTPARFILLAALSAIGCASSPGPSGGGNAGSGSGLAGSPSAGGAVGVSGSDSGTPSAGAPGGAGSPMIGTAGEFSAGGSSSGGSSSSGGRSSSGGSSGSATGGSAGASSAAGGSGGGIIMGMGTKSAGCGKTSTVAFGAIPNEDATATPGGPKNGTGKGGYVKIGQRGFAMRLPDGYDSSKPYPLFFAFHWNGGNSADQDTGGANGYFTAYYGIQRKSNNGMIFVAPDSIGAGWNNAGDLQFTDDMVKLISDNYCVDMTNIITSGFSWGGGMSYALACARANAQTDNVGYAFRAAIIFEGALLSGCTDGKQPIAIWQKEGLTDTTCNMAGAVPIRDRFVANNKCTGWTSETGNVAASSMGMSSAEPPRPPNPGTYINPGGHVCTNYTGCSSGHPIRWCVDQSAHGNATTDGTSSLNDECANRTSQNPMGNCSAGCPCTWTPDDIWAWLNDPTTNKYTPNATKNQ